MKPTRIRMCHSLVMNYGLYKKMEIFVCDNEFVREVHVLISSSITASKMNLSLVIRQNIHRTMPLSERNLRRNAK